MEHPRIDTADARQVYRARLSLRENQTQFAERFLVTRLTIHNWETGKSSRLQPIHQRILKGLVQNLKDSGRWIHEDDFIRIYSEQLARQ